MNKETKIAKNLKSLLPAEEENALLTRAKKGEKEAIDKLLNAYMKEIIAVAKEYQGKGCSLDDLISYGKEGFRKAIENYIETHIQFFSYAIWWVRQEISQALAKS